MIVAAKQDRVFSTETETDGYQLLRLFAAYTFGSGNVAHTITARLDNATNELYRNHLSLIKDLAAGDGAQLQAALQREVLIEPLAADDDPEPTGDAAEIGLARFLRNAALPQNAGDVGELHVAADGQPAAQAKFCAAHDR